MTWVCGRTAPQFVTAINALYTHVYLQCVATSATPPGGPRLTPPSTRVSSSSTPTCWRLPPPPLAPRLLLPRLLPRLLLACPLLPRLLQRPPLLHPPGQLPAWRLRRSRKRPPLPLGAARGCSQASRQSVSLHIHTHPTRRAAPKHGLADQPFSAHVEACAALQHTLLVQPPPTPRCTFAAHIHTEGF